MASLARSTAREVAPGVTRLGSTHVGWHVVEEGGRYTVVDAGLPGQWPLLEAFLAGAGRSLAAVEAVLLTHHHDDHRGNAERIRAEAPAPVRVHPADHGPVHRRGTPLRPPLWRPFVLRYLAHLVANGIVTTPPVAEAGTFGDGEVLEVPGRPRVVHVPGHTPGSCALVFEDRGALLPGDALLTLDLVTGAPGPTVPPAYVNHDTEQAVSSLDMLERVPATRVLPSHGDPFEGTPAEAVRLARQAPRR